MKAIGEKKPAGSTTNVGCKICREILRKRKPPGGEDITANDSKEHEHALLSFRSSLCAKIWPLCLPLRVACGWKSFAHQTTTVNFIENLGRVGVGPCQIEREREREST